MSPGPQNSPDIVPRLAFPCDFQRPVTVTRREQAGYCPQNLTFYISPVVISNVPWPRPGNVIMWSGRQSKSD